MKSKFIFFLSVFAIFILFLFSAKDNPVNGRTDCDWLCSGECIWGGGFEDQCSTVDSSDSANEYCDISCYRTSLCNSASSGCYTTCSAPAGTCLNNNGTCTVSYDRLGSSSSCISQDATISCTAACSSELICYEGACIDPPPCTGGGVCDPANCIAKPGEKNTCAANNGTCAVNFDQLGPDQVGYSRCISRPDKISCTVDTCEEHYKCDPEDLLCHPVYETVDCPNYVKCMPRDCGYYSYAGVCTALDEGVCDCESNAPFACAGTCLNPESIDDSKFEAGGPCKTSGTKGKCALVDTAIGDVPTDPAQFVRRVYSLVLGMAGGIALILIMISGYRYMTSQGNPEASKAASEQLTSAIVGLLFIILSFVILQVIGVDILKIPGFG